jgi:hypothetical protein
MMKKRIIITALVALPIILCAQRYATAAPAGWMYTDGTKTGTAGIYNGTLNFNGQPADSYQARLHFNDDYPIEDSVDFTVE